MGTSNWGTADLLTYIALGLFACSVGYMLFAILRIAMFGRKLACAPRSDGQQAVTVIKPISGLEVELLENLRSFCDQDYGVYQVLFGVHSSSDPAIPLIEQVIGEYPDLDLGLVISERAIGSNLKVSNIANIAAEAKHDLLIISDSDMRVDRQYLKTVVEPFQKSDVGAVTCLYAGHGRDGLPSSLAAMFVNDWFLPSALIPAGLSEQTYCFGATMAVRRQVLDQAGGFKALADYLADDYMLGQLVVGQGYKVVLVPYVVTNVMCETSLSSLFLHELRWARTIRSVRPIGYALSAITEVTLLSVIAGVVVYLSGFGAWWALSPLVLALSLRVALHLLVAGTVAKGGTLAPHLILVRDLLSLAVRLTSYFGSRVMWRENAFTVLDDNRIKVADDAASTKHLSSQTTY